MIYESRFARPVPRAVFLRRLAALYALYSGLVFVVVVGVILTPVLHRTLHKFHWEGEDEKPDS